MFFMFGLSGVKYATPKKNLPCFLFPLKKKKLDLYSDNILVTYKAVKQKRNRSLEADRSQHS